MLWEADERASDVVSLFPSSFVAFVAGQTELVQLEREKARGVTDLDDARLYDNTRIYYVSSGPGYRYRIFFDHDDLIFQDRANSGIVERGRARNEVKEGSAVRFLKRHCTHCTEAIGTDRNIPWTTGRARRGTLMQRISIATSRIFLRTSSASMLKNQGEIYICKWQTARRLISVVGWVSSAYYKRTSIYSTDSRGCGN